MGAWNAHIRDDTAMVSEGGQQTQHDKKNNTFDERQAGSFITRWAAVQAASHKRDLELKNIEVARDVGIENAEALKQLLVRKHGTITAAWRILLTFDQSCVGTGKMSFIEFCNAMRRIGYRGSLKHLWKELDKEGRGVITLKELDPDAHEALETFRKMLIDRYGSFMKAWKQGLDTNHNGRVDEDEVVQCCKVIGYKGDVHKLFNYLLAEPGKKFLNLGDVDPQSMQAYFRGDLRAMAGDPPAKEKPAKALRVRSATAISSFGQYLGSKQRATRAQIDAENASKLMAASCLKDFKDNLIMRFGTIVTAWRAVLDTDGNGRLSFGELCNALRQMSYHGDMTQLWNELDKDSSGLISLDELDPDAETRLRDFREYLAGHYDGLENAWLKGFDTDNTKRVDADQFVERCIKMGYGTDNPNRLKHLFKSLLPERGKKHLYVDDFQALLIGVPTSDREKLWYGTPMQFVAQRPAAQTDHEAKLMGASTLKDFKNSLVQRYGTIVAAWRAALDTDGNGRLSFGELCEALRWLSFHGDKKQLWMELDKDSSGLISLDELDPEAEQTLREFREHLVEHFGGLEAGWLKGFDIRNTKRIDADQFLERCSKIRYATDDPNTVKKLFRLLLPERGKKHLVVDDFQALLIGVPTCDRKAIWSGRPTGKF